MFKVWPEIVSCLMSHSILGQKEKYVGLLSMLNKLGSVGRHFFKDNCILKVQ